MDLLYSKYASPMELLTFYFEQGRLGELINNILVIDNEQKKKENEKDNEDKLFMLYTHSFSNKTYDEWKKGVLKNNNNFKPVTKDANMTENEIVSIIDKIFS